MKNGGGNERIINVHAWEMIDHYLKTIDQIEQVLESKKVTGISISRNAVFPFIVFF